MLHPAAVLVLWGSFAFALQWASSAVAMAAAVFSLLASLRFAPRRTRNLLYRSRWLLLSLAALFLFFTPGEYLPGVAGSAGVTREGLNSAGTHLGRLVALLTSLALLHERIGTPGLLSGLYVLLGGLGIREKTVVRLMLVLDQVERKEKADWRGWLVPVAAEEGAGVVHLRLPPVKTLDRWLIGSMLLGMLAVSFLS
jgi:hypothetical protein